MSEELETIVDDLSELLDAGLSVPAAIARISSEMGGGVDFDLVAKLFTSIYMCTPEEYAQNISDDAEWVSETVLDDGFDDLSVL